MTDCKKEPAAWEVYEYRNYGAPGETRRRIFWVADYRNADGIVSGDLEWLLDHARRPGGYDGAATTIHIKPLFYGDDK